MKVQRGEIEEDDWLNAIQEIKDKYKYKGQNMIYLSISLIVVVGLFLHTAYEDYKEYEEYGYN